MNKQIDDYFNRFKNIEVSKSTSGGGAGSILKIDLAYKNSYFFIYCSWRLESKGTVLATSNDNADANIGLIAKSVRLIENKKITSINVSRQFDLTMYFEDDFKLNVFCDISYSSSEDESYYDTNWELCIPGDDIYFKITNFFELEKGKYH